MSLRVTKAILRELAAALAVIAVFTLAFVSQPGHVAPVANATLSFSELSYCGDGHGKDSPGSHGPCHACRLKVAIVPAPPAQALPAFAGFYAFAHAEQPALPTLDISVSSYDARAPPRTA